MADDTISGDGKVMMQELLIADVIYTITTYQKKLRPESTFRGSVEINRPGKQRREGQLIIKKSYNTIEIGEPLTLILKDGQKLPFKAVGGDSANQIYKIVIGN